MSESLDPPPRANATPGLRVWPWPVAIVAVALLSLAGGVWLAALLAVTWLVLQRPAPARLLERALGSSDGTGWLAVSPHRGGRVGVLWWLGGIVALGAAILILEGRQPFYFSQDDNLVQFLPVILQGSESLFSGVFPTWNAHQFLGAPTSSVGTYALTYPITYLSYAVARFLLGNPNLTLEVFCWSHLVIGLAATYAACRAFGVRASLATAVGLSFVLTGYFLIVGRAWYYMLPAAAWMPCLVLALAHLFARAPSWRWMLGTGVVVGLWFHAGNVQMWLYGMTFFGLVVALWLGVGALPWRRTVAIASALLVGAGLACPLLLPQLAETAELPRAQLGEGIGAGLWSLVLPWPLVDAPHPNAWGGVEAERMGQLYFTGTALALPALAAMLALACVRFRRSTTAANVFVPVAWVAFLFALGREGYLWSLSGLTPPFDKFTQPFKYLPFFVLFALLSGAMFTERLLRQARRPVRWEAALYGISVALVLYHVSIATATVTRWGFEPYPDLPGALRGLESKSARLYSMAPERAGEPEYLAAQMHNLPTVYDLFSLGGYDPLVRDSPANLRVLEVFEQRPTIEVMQAYGVRWLLLYIAAEHRQRARSSPLDPVNQVVRQQDLMRDVLLEDGAGRRVVGDLEVLTLPNPAPLAFAVGDGPQALPVHFDGAGATVDLAPVRGATAVVVNVLWRSHLRGYVDGRGVEIAADDWGRARVQVPPDAASLRVRYEPPFGRGMVLGILVMAIGLATFRFGREGGTGERSGGGTSEA